MYPEFLSDVADKLVALLVSEGLAGKCAEAISRKHVDAIRRDWGGIKIYIRSGRVADKTKRNAEIARRWNGRNTWELCREFGISEVRLREIAAEHRRKQGH